MNLPAIDSQELANMWSEGEEHVDKDLVDLPSTLDWREKGWVSQVQLQVHNSFFDY